MSLRGASRKWVGVMPPKMGLKYGNGMQYLQPDCTAFSFSAFAPQRNFVYSRLDRIPRAIRSFRQRKASFLLVDRLSSAKVPFEAKTNWTKRAAAAKPRSWAVGGGSTGHAAKVRCGLEPAEDGSHTYPMPLPSMPLLLLRRDV